MRRLFVAMCLLIAVCPATFCPAAFAEPVNRPLIWVTAAERQPLRDKIKAQLWAKASFEAMQERVKNAVQQHKNDRDAFLRGLPLLMDGANPQRHPKFPSLGAAVKETGVARGKIQLFLQIGVDCGVLYFITQDKGYAECAADILNAFVEAMVQMKTGESAITGGWIYPDDLILETRIFGAQLPLIYDFVFSYLKEGATVYDIAGKQLKPFNYEHAQRVFRTYARLVIEHGLVNNNHPVLEMPCLAHNVLALDDAKERAQLLEYVLSKDSPHQDSLKKVIGAYAQAGAVWPESFQYSYGVSSLATYLVALMQRQSLSHEFLAAYANIPLSLARLRDFRFPNGENIRFGDGPRQSGAPYDSFEIAYALGQRQRDNALQQTFGALINLGIEQREYNRATPRGHNFSANVYLSPLQLLWFAPEISGKMTPPAVRTTDELPFVGALLQRNFSPDKNPAHALMAVVSGGHHVHGHASGMALELYGAGEVLGANAGKGTYTTDEHENYRRLFAAHNSVIVNGASRSAGGWVNLGIETVRKISLEPAVGEEPVSRSHSFSVTTFQDNQGQGAKGGNAKAKQERLVGIVRTSERSGYYVDVFRSQSERPEQFHDYLYHNLGDKLTMTSAGGFLPLADSPGRFVPAPGTKWNQNKNYLFPGWHVFKNPQVSQPFAQDVTVDFTATQLKPNPARMRLFVLGNQGREYAQALAPATKEAPQPYEKLPTPVVVIRQRGEAWNQPFAVIYEPFFEESGTVQSVKALGGPANFAGFQVTSQIQGRVSTQYILVLPSSTSVFEEPKLGIALRGRYAVISLNERGECTALYLGEGSHLAFKSLEISSLNGTNTAAAVEITGNDVTFNANDAAQLTLPGGKRILAVGRGDLK